MIKSTESLNNYNLPIEIKKQNLIILFMKVQQSDKQATAGGNKMKKNNNITLITAEAALIILIILFTIRGVHDYLNTADEYEPALTAGETVNAEIPVPDSAEPAINTEDEHEENAEPTASETPERLNTNEHSYEQPALDSNARQLRFRSKKLLNQHYEKHGMDMGFKSAAEYEQAASAAALNPDALHKTEKDDGDDVYYITATNEFVIVSTDGYIRTYFRPDSGIKYYNKQ